MSSPSKQRGTRFESEVVQYLIAAGFVFAERRALAGNQDKGDIAGIVGWTIECKNQARMALGEWCKEVASESVNAQTRRWAVIHKRRQTGVAGSYVTLPLWAFAELLADEKHLHG